MTIQAKSQALTSAIIAMEREIGATPLLHIKSLSTGQVQVYAKAEWKQLSGSVKARAGYWIIRRAIEDGLLTPDKRLLDASSGNTAIAYATILKRLGIGCTICLPSNASAERISTLRALDTEIIFTSPFEGTEGAQQKARQMAADHPDLYYYADQYGNPANIDAHYYGTSIEILDQTSNQLSHFVAGLGTTGTFCGTALRLKEETEVRTVALQPDSALHIMEGWKHLETADVPGIFRPDLIDEQLEIDSEDVFAMIKDIDRKEGLRLSPSSAANLVGASMVAKQLTSGLIVTVLPDSIERYQQLNREIFGV